MRTGASLPFLFSSFPCVSMAATHPAPSLPFSRSMSRPQPRSRPLSFLSLSFSAKRPAKSILARPFFLRYGRAPGRMDLDPSFLPSLQGERLLSASSSPFRVVVLSLDKATVGDHGKLSFFPPFSQRKKERQSDEPPLLFPFFRAFPPCRSSHVEISPFPSRDPANGVILYFIFFHQLQKDDVKLFFPFFSSSPPCVELRDFSYVLPFLFSPTAGRKLYRQCSLFSS